MLLRVVCFVLNLGNFTFSAGEVHSGAWVYGHLARKSNFLLFSAFLFYFKIFINKTWRGIRKVLEMFAD